MTAQSERQEARARRPGETRPEIRIKKERHSARSRGLSHVTGDEEEEEEEEPVEVEAPAAYRKTKPKIIDFQDLTLGD